MTSGHLPRPPIPATAQDLTPDWFSTALDARVESVALERLGGLSSMVYRARLHYANDGAAPTSVVVKLALDPRPGPPGMAAPGFDREVRFYRELAPQMNVAVPACHWSGANPATGDWVLMLEDFPGHTARADEAFATPEEMRMLLTEIARVHAAWWGSAELESYTFLRTLPDFISMVEGQLPRGVPLFLERFAGRLEAEDRAVFEALPAIFRAAVEPLDASPKTLVHHDLCLRNALFRKESWVGMLSVAGGIATSVPGQPHPAAPSAPYPPAQPPIVLIDWGLPQRNAGVRDVSYLIGASLPPERRASDERAHLRFYLDCLHELGVRGYSFEQLTEDYRRSVVCDFGRMAMTAGHAHLSAGMEAAVAHQLACRAGSARELDLLALMQPD